MTTLSQIRAVAMDVDGVLTDGTMLLQCHLNGREFKSLNYRDIMGISLGKKAGLKFCLISGEDASWAAERIGLPVSLCFSWCREKGESLSHWSKQISIPLDQIAFIGDDVNDIPAMKIAGVCAAPSDAHESAWAVPGIIELSKRGGSGFVRELIDMILSAKRAAN